MAQLIVRTISTATVEEEWVLDAPDSLDFDRHQWASWQDMLAQGAVTILSVETLDVGPPQDRQARVVENVRTSHVADVA